MIIIMERIHIKNIPKFLQNSDLYKTLTEDLEEDDQTIELPRKYYTKKLVLRTSKDVFKALEIFRFWGLYCLPQIMYECMLFIDYDEQFRNDTRSFLDYNPISELMIFTWYIQNHRFVDNTYENVVDIHHKPIEIIIRGGYLNLLKYVYEKLKYPHNIQFRDKKCLSYAIMYDQLDCFKYLIDRTDKLDYKSSKHIIDHESAKHAFKAAYCKTKHTIVEYVNNNEELQWLRQAPRISYQYSGARQSYYNSYVSNLYRNGISASEMYYIKINTDNLLSQWKARVRTYEYLKKNNYEVLIKLANYMFSPGANGEIKLLQS